MIKNLLTFAVLGGALTGLALAQAPAAAPAAVPTKIAVIQVQAALGATKEGQKAAADLETKMGPRKKELDGKQAEIKELQDRLQRGGNTLSDSAKEDLTRNIDAKTKSFNRQLEDAQAELEQEQQKVLGGLGQKMMAVIDKYAQQNGFAIGRRRAHQHIHTGTPPKNLPLLARCHAFDAGEGPPSAFSRDQIRQTM